MNRWLMLRRLRWPAFLILFGIMALLNQWGVLSFHRSWPLFLILAGILLLAERAALAGDPIFPPPGQPHAPPPGSSSSMEIIPAPMPSAPAANEPDPGENWKA